MGVPGVVCIDWTKERVEQLKVLWAEGLSAGQIGAEMGVSRNAIIGKVQRLKLPGRATIVRKPQEPGAPVRSDPRADAGMIRRIVKKVASPAEEGGVLETGALTDLPPDQSPSAVAFLARSHRQCAWPLNAVTPIDQHMACGSPRDGDHSYCRRHHRLSIQAYRPRAPELSDAVRAQRAMTARKNLAAHKERLMQA